MGSLLRLAFGMTHIPDPPTGGGIAHLFVSDRDIRAELFVRFENAFSQRPCITTILLFSGVEPGTDFNWALVLTGHAKLVMEEGGGGSAYSASEPIEVVERELAIPKSAPARLDAQVLSGQGTMGKGSDVQTIEGCLVDNVSTSGRTRLYARLPVYGRGLIVPGMSEAREAEEWDLGIPGEWHPSHRFKVVIEMGEVDQTLSLDTISPSLNQPANLVWRNDEAIAVRIAATKTHELNELQIALLLIGTAIGVLASVVVMATDRATQRIMQRRRPGISL